MMLPTQERICELLAYCYRVLIVLCIEYFQITALDGVAVCNLLLFGTA